MKVIWCWRCKTDIPMLDEDEYKVINEIYSQSMRDVKSYRERNGASLSNTPIEEFFAPVRDSYEEMAGVKGSNHNAIMHHRISIYGESCGNCGKPLRTPEANFCAACGQVKIKTNQS